LLLVILRGEYPASPGVFVRKELLVFNSWISSSGCHYQPFAGAVSAASVDRSVDIAVCFVDVPTLGKRSDGAGEGLAMDLPLRT
jgi:hypothetical protein